MVSSFNHVIHHVIHVIHSHIMVGTMVHTRVGTEDLMVGGETSTEITTQDGAAVIITEGAVIITEVVTITEVVVTITEVVCVRQESGLAKIVFKEEELIIFFLPPLFQLKSFCSKSGGID